MHGARDIYQKENVNPKASVLFLFFTFDNNDRQCEDFIGNPYKHVEDVGGICHPELHSYMLLL